MRSAVARKLEDKGPDRGLKSKEPLAEPLKKQTGAEVPLSGNALFTFRLLSGNLHTGSVPKPAEKPEATDKSKDKPVVGKDVSEFEDRVMW